MAEELADHWQALAERYGTRGKGMSEVVDADVVKAGALADAPPGMLQVGQGGTRLLGGETLRK